MAEFIFFKKGNSVAALDKADAQGARMLIEQGYIRQFEEITAPDGQHALARFDDIKKEEELGPFVWATGALFCGLIVPVIGLIGWLLLR
ncbi:hypothetical protein PAS25_00240 [Leclercia adecarboxylata]|uniref:Uncharacterized protein n=2 Tax=Leclercia TaxID=83654 RepID=A0ABS7RQD6_9ENTR|nr:MULTISPECIES: hypothetical protein [Leclercia]MBZ0056559.1 hypothetical protein [Leclercia sp. EMC7]MCM5694519.1 hypothetical protein [Leclercia sp. LTM01]QCZ25773.1 hypothetical protein FHN83_03545 [Leclercia adecarboxylata]